MNDLILKECLLLYTERVKIFSKHVVRVCSIEWVCDVNYLKRGYDI